MKAAGVVLEIPLGLLRRTLERAKRLAFLQGFTVGTLAGYFLGAYAAPRPADDAGDVGGGPRAVADDCGDAACADCHRHRARN